MYFAFLCQEKKLLYISPQKQIKRLKKTVPKLFAFLLPPRFLQEAAGLGQAD